MSDKLAEIRKRHERDDILRDGLCPGAHADRAFLLAEVERMRAEIERMQAEMPVAKSLETAVTCLTIERDKARSVVAGLVSEIADLRVEVQRLHKEHEVACMGGELLRDEIKRLRAENAQLTAELNTMKAGFEVAYRMTGGKP